MPRKARECFVVGCGATERSPGGLVNTKAYSARGDGEQWLCSTHLPPDWIGYPSKRLFPHEMLAVHKYVEDNPEEFSKSRKSA